MKNLKIYRKQAGFSTQEQLAAYLGVSRPVVDDLPRIAAALNITVDELLDRDFAAKPQ